MEFILVTFLVRNLTLPGAFSEVSTITTSAGAADAGKVPNLDSTGKLDVSVIPGGSGGTTTLQGAYNNGPTIVTTGVLGPVIIKGYTTADVSFKVQDSTGTDVLDVSSDKKVTVSGEVKAEHYTGSVVATVATNSANVQIDSVDATIFRAVQYSYTIANSDNSGYESGKITIIQDGTNSYCFQSQEASTGTPCGTVFSSGLVTGNMILYATTDNSGAFSRIIHLFKIALS